MNGFISHLNRMDVMTLNIFVTSVLCKYYVSLNIFVTFVTSVLCKYYVSLNIFVTFVTSVLCKYYVSLSNQN